MFPTNASQGFDYQASYYIPPQYNQYGKTFWIPTQVEPTVALIGTSVPALLRIGSAAALQFSKIRSAVASSLGLSEASGSQHSQPRENNREGMRQRMPTSAAGSKSQAYSESDMELNLMDSEASRAVGHGGH
jgi:hypothetical protein